MLLLVTTSALVLWAIFRYDRTPYALAIAGSTPAGVVLASGNIGVPAFYGAASALLIVSLFAMVSRRHEVVSIRTRVPGLTLLALCASWATLVTLTAPIVFDGLPTVLPLPGRLTAGVITSSNVAQLTYFWLGVVVFAFIASTPLEVKLRVLGFPIVLVILLSTWRYLYTTFGVPFPEGAFDNSPSANFIESSAGGGVRVRGILTEPAGLATCCLLTVAWGCSTSAATNGWRKWAAFGIVVPAAYLGFISTSTTFFVAGLLCALVALMIQIVSFIATRLRVGAAGAIGLLSAVGAFVLVLPQFAAVVTDAINVKLNSSSFTDRSGSNEASWQQVANTYGFGAGLGANRGSSLLASLAGSIGLVGVALFGAAILTVLYAGFRHPSVRPAFWVIVVALLTRLISGPDLSDPSGIFWIALGLLARASMRSQDSLSSVALTSRSV